MGTIKHNKYGYYINAVVFYIDDSIVLGDEVYQIYLQEIETISSDEPYHIIYLKDSVRGKFFEDIDAYLLHFDGSMKSVLKELGVLGIPYKLTYINMKYGILFDTIEEVKRYKEEVNDYEFDTHIQL